MPQTITLRPIEDDDLPIFFAQQLDAEANHMAAFTPRDPADRQAFDAHWQRIRADAAITHRTVVCDDVVAGYVTCFLLEGEPDIGYWFGREFWGRGLATAALRLFLCEVPQRPLYARVAQDNAASLRVLQKCGFVITDSGRWFANARGQEIAEWVLTLSGDANTHSS